MAAIKKSFDLNTKKLVKDKAPRKPASFTMIADGLKTMVDELFSSFGSLSNREMAVRADSFWDQSFRRQWEWKLHKPEFEKALVFFDGKVRNKSFTAQWPQDGDVDMKALPKNLRYKLKFTLSAKKGAGKADAKTTAKQERASAYVLGAALMNNAGFGSWKDISKYSGKVEDVVEGKTFNSVTEAWTNNGTEGEDTDLSEEWLDVFYKQQKTLLNKLKKRDYKKFNREGGFMKFISDIVKDKFGISQKDNWNPADIWAIKDQAAVEKIIEETVDGNGSQTILELNAVLRKMFQEERVVGISLKKVSGKDAQWEVINVEELGLEEDRDYNYGVQTPTINLTFSTKKQEFGTQDARIVVNGNQADYDFQIKANDSAKDSNLKFEPTQSGARAARVGKAPVAMVQALLKDNKVGTKFVNRHIQYAKDYDEFVANKGASPYTSWDSVFTSLKGHGVPMGINTVKQFQQSMRRGFDSEKPYVANSKLMQMKFLNVVMEMTEKKRQEFMTDMVFLSAKRGKRFGPFGKLY